MGFQTKLLEFRQPTDYETNIDAFAPKAATPSSPSMPRLLKPNNILTSNLLSIDNACAGRR
jgi:hypothetical protein